MENAKRVVGTCRSWVRDFGFLQTEAEDGIFCHFTSIEKSSPNEFRVLVPGKKYSFILTQGEKGPVALDVRNIKEYDYASEQSPA